MSLGEWLKWSEDWACAWCWNAQWWLIRFILNLDFNLDLQLTWLNRLWWFWLRPTNQPFSTTPFLSPLSSIPHTHTPYLSLYIPPQLGHRLSQIHLIPIDWSSFSHVSLSTQLPFPQPWPELKVYFALNTHSAILLHYHLFHWFITSTLKYHTFFLSFFFF